MIRVARGLLVVLVVLVAVGSAAAATRPAAPRTVGLTLEGERLALSSLRGRPVLINVWSSW